MERVRMVMIILLAHGTHGKFFELSFPWATHGFGFNGHKEAQKAQD
jgi:hypothetical protein